MDTLEELGQRIATTQDLGAIVRTMKTLAAVSIRQYESAVLALREYSRTIESGLQVVLRSGRAPGSDAQETENPATLAVVFGSDHGLCGRFNAQIARFAHDELQRRSPGDAVYLVAGARAAAQLEALGIAAERCFTLPGSVNGLTAMAHELLLEIDQRRPRESAARVLLFYNERSESSTAAPRSAQLLPLAAHWLRRLARQRWPSRASPLFTMDAEALFTALVRQYLFIGLFRAGAESAASEHAMRLMAMQAAERNIKDNLDELHAGYRRQRQESITAELLDIVAGFEALEAEDGTEGRARAAR